MPRTRHPAQNTARILTLGAAIGVSALAIWSGSTPSQEKWNSAYADPPQNAQTEYEATIKPAAYEQGATVASDTSANCNPWDVSPEAMEAILQEMIRRGWQPPSGDMALANAQFSSRQPIEALTTTPTASGELASVSRPSAGVIETEAALATATAQPEAAPAESSASTPTTPGASQPQPSAN